MSAVRVLQLKLFLVGDLLFAPLSIPALDAEMTFPCCHYRCRARRRRGGLDSSRCVEDQEPDKPRRGGRAEHCRHFGQGAPVEPLRGHVVDYRAERPGFRAAFRLQRLGTVPLPCLELQFLYVYLCKESLQTHFGCIVTLDARPFHR